MARSCCPLSGLIHNCGSSPLSKGGCGGIFPRRPKANPPSSPFFKGGFESYELFKDKLLVQHFINTLTNPYALTRPLGPNPAHPEEARRAVSGDSSPARPEEARLLRAVSKDDWDSDLPENTSPCV